MGVWGRRRRYWAWSRKGEQVDREEWRQGIMRWERDSAGLIAIIVRVEHWREKF